MKPRLIRARQRQSAEARFSANNSAHWTWDQSFSELTGVVHLAIRALEPSSRFLAWIWAFKPWLALGDGLVGDLEGLQDLGFADSAAENAIPRLGDLALERGLIHGAEQARLMGAVLVEALAGERRNWVFP